MAYILNASSVGNPEFIKDYKRQEIKLRKKSVNY